jgi:hypothetical protein
MAIDTHHSSHGLGEGHDDHSDHKAAPHAGYFEVPVLLGILVWALVLCINYTFDLNHSGRKCCADEKCATECKMEDSGHGAAAEGHH